MLNISSSSYYYQIQAREFDVETERIKVNIKAISTESGNSYGRRRIHKALEKLGIEVGVYKTASLMKSLNIIAINPKKKHNYKNIGEEHAYFKNILNREFSPKSVNTHWVGDITYIRTHQGWSYLASVLDLATKEIVGWALSTCANANLAKKALDNAIKTQRPCTKSLMFHSDQGCQYSAKIFRNHLSILGVTQSMSRRGNCWDNAVMERFFRSLKTERLNMVSFIDHNSVRFTVDNYIHFYNKKRLHSALDYLTPFEKGEEDPVTYFV